MWGSEGIWWDGTSTPDKRKPRSSGVFWIATGTCGLPEWWSQGQPVSPDNLLFPLGILCRLLGLPHTLPTTNDWNMTELVRRVDTIARRRRLHSCVTRVAKSEGMVSASMVNSAGVNFDRYHRGACRRSCEWPGEGTGHSRFSGHRLGLGGQRAPRCPVAACRAPTHAQGAKLAAEVGEGVHFRGHRGGSALSGC